MQAKESDGQDVVGQIWVASEFWYVINVGYAFLYNYLPVIENYSMHLSFFILPQHCVCCSDKDVFHCANNNALVIVYGLSPQQMTL